MAHFCRFHFSLGLKLFILPILNFCCASNLSFQPFPIFVGAFPSRFNSFSVANLVKNLRFSSNLSNFLLKSHKIQHFFINANSKLSFFYVILYSVLRKATIIKIEKNISSNELKLDLKQETESHENVNRDADRTGAALPQGNK